jgi:hypothetical protein
MKHTIKGKHGHNYQLPPGKYDPASGLKWIPVCATPSEMAKSDFYTAQIKLREGISRKWKVCLWCWAPDPRWFLRDLKSENKVLAFECDKCQPEKVPPKHR